MFRICDSKYGTPQNFISNFFWVAIFSLTGLKKYYYSLQFQAQSSEYTDILTLIKAQRGFIYLFVPCYVRVVTKILLSAFTRCQSCVLFFKLTLSGFECLISFSKIKTTNLILIFKRKKRSNIYKWDRNLKCVPLFIRLPYIHINGFIFIFIQIYFSLNRLVSMFNKDVKFINKVRHSKH